MPSGALEGRPRQACAARSTGDHGGHLALQERRDLPATILWRRMHSHRRRFTAAIARPGLLDVYRCRTGNEACDGGDRDQLQGWQPEGVFLSSFHSPGHAFFKAGIFMADGTSDTKSSNQMWGGRFASGPDGDHGGDKCLDRFRQEAFRPGYPRFNRACDDARRIKASFRADDKDKIVHGLNTILSEIESGNFEFSRQLEDIHMNVEARLATLIGPAAGRLHTARSRNDQVALDFRLWVKEELQKTETDADRPDRRLPRPRRRACRNASCPASPICRPPSPSPSAITAWPMSKCSAATARACATPSSIWTKARSALRPLPAPAIRSTAT